MDISLLTIRILHIGLGTFWAGAMIFNAIFLVPSVRDAGPDGAKVIAGLAKRNFMQVMPVIALLTLVSGFYLLHLASGSFGPGYMGSRQGIAYSTGMLASLAAFVAGIGVVRSSMLRAGALAQAIGNAPAAERDRMQAELQALRGRAAKGGQVVAWLLGLTVVTMAVARYV
jgi:uncharacterized membrane protein